MRARTIPQVTRGMEEVARSGQDERGVVLVAPLQLVLDGVERGQDVVAGLRDLALETGEDLDGLVQLVVVEGTRVREARIRDEPLDAASREEHLLLGDRDANGLAATRALRLGGEDLGEPVDERAAVVAAAPLDLGAEDLGASLDEAAEQREVLALGEALVASRAQILERQAVDPLEEIGATDPVDAAVPLLLAHVGSRRRACVGAES